MRKMQKSIVEGKGIFVGLEDSKRSWKVCVRCQGMIVHEASMPAEFAVLRQYLRSRYPDCEIRVMYEAGFGGFWLHDALMAEGIACVVTPPNKVTQEKMNKVKTDRVDARRLARNLESGDYAACHVPDQERREDRQISRTSQQIQGMIVATKNRIRRFLEFHGLDKELPPGSWEPARYHALRAMSLSYPLRGRGRG